MPKLSALVRTKPIAIEWETGETLNVVVVPDKLTGNALIEMQERVKVSDGKEQDELRFMCSFLATIIQSWDLTDENGAPVEISEENLFSTLPVTIVGMLLSEIQKGITVSP